MINLAFFVFLHCKLHAHFAQVSRQALQCLHTRNTGALLAHVGPTSAFGGRQRCSPVGGADRAAQSGAAGPCWWVSSALSLPNSPYTPLAHFYETNWSSHVNSAASSFVIVLLLCDLRPWILWVKGEMYPKCLTSLFPCSTFSV